MEVKSLTTAGMSCTAGSPPASIVPSASPVAPELTVILTFIYSLESQLNTLGIRGAVYESVPGKPAAFTKYAEAAARQDVASLAPAYSAEATDLFL